MRRFIKFFSSIKLAIILLICLAGTSILGTIIAQKQNPAAYIKYFGEVGYRLLNFLGLFDVYHSWWFLALLVLLSLNIFFCAFRRLNRDMKRLKKQTHILDKEEAKGYKLNRQENFSISLAHSKDILTQKLRTHMKGNLIEKTGDKGEVLLFSEKMRQSWMFFHFTHVSILIILFGGILSALLGVKGYVQITEGESADKFYEYASQKQYDFGFTVKCEKFDIEFYPESRTPKDYKSWLTIIEDGNDVAKKVVEVNDPLSYKGMTLYQSSYGKDIHSGTFVIEALIRDANINIAPIEIKTMLNHPFDFDGHNGKKVTVQVENFYPDFMMDEQRNVFTKSDQLNNPAIRMMITEEGDEPYRVWSFLMMPDPHMHGKGDYNFKFKDYESKFYTGLQVGKDPGVLVVWLGCILLMIGVILVLFSSHQRIWITLSPHNTGVDLSMVGFADKNKYAFETKFNNLWDDVKGALS